MSDPHAELRKTYRPGQRLPSGLLLAKDAIREFARVNAGLTIPASGKLGE